MCKSSGEKQASQSPRAQSDCLQIACFAWPAVQKPKVLDLQQKSQKSSTFSYLSSWNQSNVWHLYNKWLTFIPISASQRRISEKKHNLQSKVKSHNWAILTQPSSSSSSSSENRLSLRYHVIDWTVSSSRIQPLSCFALKARLQYPSCSYTALVCRLHLKLNVFPSWNSMWIILVLKPSSPINKTTSRKLEGLSVHPCMAVYGTQQ